MKWGENKKRSPDRELNPKPSFFLQEGNIWLYPAWLLFVALQGDCGKL